MYQSNQFKVGMYDCCSDPWICLLSYCVPGGACCLQALAVDKAIHQGAVGPYCFACFGLCFGSAANRGRIREAYGIPGSYCEDCCLALFHSHLAPIQEYNDSKMR